MACHNECSSLSLISWQTHNALHKTMPQCFIDSFRYKTTVIIDCIERLLTCASMKWKVFIKT